MPIVCYLIIIILDNMFNHVSYDIMLELY